MEEEMAFSKIFIQDRCQHKAWKARLSGYESALELFEDLEDEKSPEYSKYLGLLKKFVIDSNVKAREKGLAAVLAFVKKAACAPDTVADVMSGLVSKCFSLSRAKSKELALEITLMYIEIEKQDVVLEELIKGFESRSPKTVTTSVIAVREALHAFGSKVISVEAIMKFQVKLLEDRDRDVREESKQLCVEIYRWVGNAINIQLQFLNHFTRSELEKEFEKIGPVPTRYLRSQQKKMSKCHKNAEVAYDANIKVVNALSKLPKHFYEQCEAKKWKERKEPLNSLLALTTGVKLGSGDYENLVRTLIKLIGKDSNILVVTLSTRCLTNLINGLKKEFQSYASACIPTIFEKFKEKNRRVVLVLREAIDALYSVCSFDAMTDAILSALGSKNPQVKAETVAFLTRTFCKISFNQLNKELLKTFIPPLLKTLKDTDAVVRENSAEAIGTVLKVVGDHNMVLFLMEVDSIKKAKIDYFCAKAVTAKS